jgi:phosphoribosylformylglycinamidine synthase
MPESIHLTAKLCRLLGYYVAEGSVSNYGKGYTIRFSFNKNETDYITDVCDILQEIGLNHCKTSQNNVTHVCLKSTPFALFIADMLGCGRISTQKQLPDFIYFAPRSFKEEFLSGYLRGDGCFSPDSSMIQAGTASRLLVAGLDILLLSMGYVMTCGKRITSPSIIAGRTIKGGFLHTLTTKTQRQYNGLAEICEFDQVDFRTHSKQLWHTLRNVLYMIRTAKVTHEEKEQTVYSIDTQKHLFVSTNGRLIHNCVIPNLDLINDETLNFIKILNNKYMKKLRKK